MTSIRAYGEYVRQVGTETDNVEREILEIERNIQQTVAHIYRLRQKLNQAETDAQIGDMALSRIITYYQREHPEAPQGREELLRYLEEGDE